MKVLLIGSGGREHALAWKLAKSPLLEDLYCAPGNAGIGRIATLVDIAADDVDALVKFAVEEKIDFVVPGPEVCLVYGLVDALNEHKIPVFGPTKAAAQLEGSKGFMKDICAKYNIPTAKYQRFTEAAPAKDYLKQFKAPYVIKADGLAAGKGAVIAPTLEEAEQTIDEMLAGQFGDASQSLVIEEFMHGEEASLFALVDGETALLLPVAQDHKRVFDNDEGPNTGGMGAYAPAPVMDQALIDRAMREIIQPTVEAMKAEGAPYKGVLYAGLMITDEGPKLIEYNVRFGDPECQVLMMLMQTDLLEVLIAARRGDLQFMDLKWHQGAVMTVVMAANGYPGSYEKGSVIRGLGHAEQEADVRIFHAGTALQDKAFVANGGRVLNVTALGKDLQEARDKVYKAIDMIDWPEGFCRRDIGWRVLGK